MKINALNRDEILQEIIYLTASYQSLQRWSFCVHRVHYTITRVINAHLVCSVCVTIVLWYFLSRSFTYVTSSVCVCLVSGCICSFCCGSQQRKLFRCVFGGTCISAVVVWWTLATTAFCCHRSEQTLHSFPIIFILLIVILLSLLSLPVYEHVVTEAIWQSSLPMIVTWIYLVTARVS